MFHLQLRTDRKLVDLQRVEFANIVEARAVAETVARQIVNDEAFGGVSIDALSIEICDDGGFLLDIIRFRDTILFH